MELAQTGKTTASFISKRTKIPRASVYSVLADLSARGVISVEQTRGSSFYVVNNPRAFMRLIDDQREALVAKEDAANELVAKLVPFLSNAPYAIPKLQIFEGRQSIENMLYDYLSEWRKSMELCGDSTLWGYQDPTFVEQYRRWHDHLWRTMGKKEKICLFSNRSSVEKELSLKIEKREVRALPDDSLFSSSIWLYGDFIVMGMTREKPHYAYQLRDSTFAANLRTIFKLLWRAKLE